MCLTIFTDLLTFTEERPATLLKKKTLIQVFSCEFCETSKNTFSYRTYPVVASVILLSLLWNHVQSQQQRNKVRSDGSLGGGVVEGSSEASSFG